MTSHRRSRTRGRTSDASLDPSTYFGAPASGPDRKTFQLCRQVERILTLVLGGECRDEILTGVVVDAVTPAPDASHLLVTVVPLGAASDTDAILRSLQEMKPFFRAAVASGIHRKRAPELSFVVGWRSEEEAP